MKTAAEILANKQKRLVTVPANATIYEALEKMTSAKIGAILVTGVGKEDQIVGIWTERDLMRNSLLEGFNPRTARIEDYMTTNLHTAQDTATVFELKDMLLGLFIRHMIIKKGEEFVGILSVGDLVRASLHMQDQHIRDLKAQTSWHYYENWRWDRQ
ncbi:MAG TPA: CBS domain-containing protein [Calditrichia bacterium]|nr:CBS domain-containing protein [Calditrichota bacterium]HQU71890.1 CBS domain-containing protein [Calditrichia bacterium]HQV32026.1 CBS domain-containing protein [Calditrichia bacterium]